MPRKATAVSISIGASVDRARPKQYNYAELVPKYINSEKGRAILKGFDDANRAILNERQLAVFLHIRQVAAKRRISQSVFHDRKWRREHAINGLTLNSLFSRGLLGWSEEGEYLEVDQKT